MYIAFSILLMYLSINLINNTKENNNEILEISVGSD